MAQNVMATSAFSSCGAPTSGSKMMDQKSLASEDSCDEASTQDVNKKASDASPTFVKPRQGSFVEDLIGTPYRSGMGRTESPSAPSCCRICMPVFSSRVAHSILRNPGRPTKVRMNTAAPGPWSFKLPSGDRRSSSRTCRTSMHINGSDDAAAPGESTSAAYRSDSITEQMDAKMPPSAVEQYRRASAFSSMEHRTATASSWIAWESTSGPPLVDMGSSLNTNF
mmetsp:Transcript_17983/g.49882  ORF Transcript_17983/g.49882 Transcript_17983/m.49882 type:complete len:224 (+) Transcript_17983:2422-3093(+)